MDTNPEETESSLEPEQGIGEEKKRKTISIKTAIIIAVVLVIGALAYGYRGLLIAATVNGSPISRLSVISELEKKSGKAALDELITKKLIDDEAKKNGVTVSDDEVSAEITKIDDQIKAQGKALSEVLLEQGMTESDLRLQITIQKKLEKLLADKTQVADDEIKKFIADNKVVVPAGQEETYKNQARDQLTQNKLRDAAGLLIDSLRSQASINYFTNY